MGVASKRRGGSSGSNMVSSGVGNNSRSSKNSKVKDASKLHKGDDSHEGYGKNKGVSGSKGRVNRRGRSTSPTPDSSRRRSGRTIDPSKMGWGMTSRLVGARVAQQMPVLTPDEIERDIRHMEAYGNACAAYAQQFFIFNNRNLVQSGHFGPVSGPGLAASEHFLPNGDAYGYQARASGYEGGQYGAQRQESSPRSTAYQIRDGRVMAASSFSMPVRIDPEEEKRVAMLRKRIAASEAQREVLETEYIALRAHYVTESQKLRDTRISVDGQVNMLQELVRKRGKVLALKRVRIAVARDILTCLERRTQLPTSEASEDDQQKSDDGNAESNTAPQSMEGVELTDGDAERIDKTERSENELADVLELWNDIERQLKEAEQSCMNLEAPRTKQNASSRSNSKDEAIMNGGTTKKKARRGSDDSGTPSEKEGRRFKEAGILEDDGVIQWQAQIIPRTPFGVPVYLSYLSGVPDKAAGFGCAGMFGSKKHSMSWIESNIPESFENMGSERDEMLRLREESQFLADELDKERQTNKELQRQIISGRKRNDEMCAMMTMLRSETEAVLNRHNLLLDTDEGRFAAEALRSDSQEDGVHPGDDYDELEETEGAALDEKHIDQVRVLHAMSPEEEGEVYEDDDVDDGEDQVSLSEAGRKEAAVAVDLGAKVDVHEEDNDGDDEGEIGEEDDEEEGEIRAPPPPQEVFFGEGNHHDGDWGQRKDGLLNSDKGGAKRTIGERDSEEFDYDLDDSASSPSLGSSKRRRRI